VPDAHPCRLFVFLARDAPVGVVLRRGPSNWFRLSLWRTDTDHVEHGQWMSGRVFERRSDLAPDGSLFVYFARRAAGPLPPDAGAADSWVAISRPPYFKALALWFVGGTYWVGGFFPPAPAPRSPARALSVFVGGGTWPPSQGTLPPWLHVTGELPFVDRTHQTGDRLVFHNRLLRDGWARIAGHRAATWERPQPNGEWTLVLVETGWDAQAYGGPYVVEYAVYSTRAGVFLPLADVTWADWDHRGRLVVAQRGRLLAGQPGTTLREIADFNAQVPEPAPAPPWAHEWP
jgi:hypothetical protein